MENVEKSPAWHQTQMQLMAKWAIYIAITLAFLGVGAAVAIRVLGQALELVSTHRIDWGAAQTLALVLIGLGIVLHGIAAVLKSAD